VGAAEVQGGEEVKPVEDDARPGGRPVDGTAATHDTQPGLAVENERLRARVAALEAELVEVQSRTNQAIAKWQEQVYWLDRWHLDLDALMRRPGAMQALGTLRAVRSVWWRVKVTKRRLLGPS
jgi:hypothetical protein